MFLEFHLSPRAFLQRAIRASLVIFLAAAGAARVAAGPEPRVIPIWPEGVPGLHADASDEKVVNGRYVNIHKPTLLFFAPEKPNGTAVIYCPGGGYVRISFGQDGGPEVAWMRNAGVSVFILKYRLNDYGHPAPLQDVLRAVRLVRSRAAEFGIDPKRIGVFGGSAGAHLAGCAATLWDSPEGNTGADLDNVSARPDFAALLYPVVTMEDPYVHAGSREALFGKNPTPEQRASLSLEQHVRKDMPPTFVVATEADKTVPVQNSLKFYDALVKAGVPAELHVYPQGSHGSSVDPQYGPTAEWPKRMEEWMRFNGWLPHTN
jgi:acetyl esterase/lipase